MLEKILPEMLKGLFRLLAPDASPTLVDLVADKLPTVLATVTDPVRREHEFHTAIAEAMAGRIPRILQDPASAGALNPRPA